MFGNVQIRGIFLYMTLYSGDPQLRGSSVQMYKHYREENYKKAHTLSSSEPNSKFIVDRIPVDDQSLLKYMGEHNVIPGKFGDVKEINKSAGTISINCAGSESVFGLTVGNLIWVTPN